MNATAVEASGTITVPGQYGGTLVSYRIDLEDGAQAWTNVGGKHTEVAAALSIAHVMMNAMLWAHQLVRYPKQIADAQAGKRETFVGREVRVRGMWGEQLGYILAVDTLREQYVVGLLELIVSVPLQDVLEVLPWP